MNQKHRNTLDSCYNDVVHRIKLANLWPQLLENKVFNRDDVNVPRWTKNLSNEETVRDVYLTIKTRGPFAFDRFLTSLRQSGHENVADVLEGKNDVVASADVNANTRERSVAEDTINDRVQHVAHPERKDDNFFHSIQLAKEPLRIQVRKATQFLDGPAYENVQRYPMRSKPHGLVLLITNIKYTYMERHRTSAKHDEANLTELFQQMGFRVISFRDLTGHELLERVKEFSQHKDLRKVDSCFVVISSHGNMDTQYEDTEIQGVDYHSNDGESKLHNYKTVLCTDILNCFTAEACPYLAGKPKIFIFQLCRGEKKQRSVQEPRHTTDTCNFHPTKTVETSRCSTGSKKTMRNYADMLVAHATTPGHVAFRDKETGSWFIQILCEVFMNYACTTHIQDLLNIVDERLGIQRTTMDECQTLTVTSIGFHKHCFPNPGLFEDT